VSFAKSSSREESSDEPGLELPRVDEGLLESTVVFRVRLVTATRAPEAVFVVVDAIDDELLDEPESSSSSSSSSLRFSDLIVLEVVPLRDVLVVELPPLSSSSSSSSSLLSRRLSALFAVVETDLLAINSPLALTSDTCHPTRMNTPRRAMSRRTSFRL